MLEALKITTLIMVIIMIPAMLIIILGEILDKRKIIRTGLFIIELALVCAMVILVMALIILIQNL